MGSYSGLLQLCSNSDLPNTNDTYFRHIYMTHYNNLFTKLELEWKQEIEISQKIKILETNNYIFDQHILGFIYSYLIE
jgi:hypothetical protein